MACGKDMKMAQQDKGWKQQKYQLAFEKSRDAIMLFKEDRFEDCNPATLAMFRVPDVDTFVTLHPADLSPPYQPNGQPSRKAASEHIDEALSQGQAFFEWRHRTWDGVDFPAEVLLSRVDLDDGALVQALVRDISDRKEGAGVFTHQQELVKAQQLAHLGSWTFDLRSKDIWWSDEVYRIFGLSREDWGASLESFKTAVHPDDRAKVQAALDSSAKGEPYKVEHRIIRPDGEQRTVLERGNTEFDTDGKPLRMLGTVLDITEQRRLEDELRKEKKLSESIMDSLPGLFYICDKKGHLVQWNDKMEELTGRSSEDLDGLNGCALFPQEEKGRIAETIAKVFAQGSAEIESKLCTVEGEIPYLFNGLRVELKGETYLLGVGLDIARQKQLEELLKQEANTDKLTGLHNRQSFDGEMERALAYHARYGNEIALAMIDLDHFKKVNDTFGHDAGDRVLMELSKRLTGQMREPDFLARWGGEEFIVILPETSLSEAAQVGERLRRCIEEKPFTKVGVITISLGITDFRTGDTPNTLLKRVDDALYQAKESGRNKVVVNEEFPDAP
ncbi:MAG: diguanylate cyclase [Pseudomonadota bacterium]